MATYVTSTPKNRKNEHNTALSAVVIKLLQGFVVVDEKKYWESLITYEEAIREYVATLGLQLHLNTDDGYAFLKQGISQLQEGETEESEAVESIEATQDENSGPHMPTLVRRIPLSFDVSLLCVLLREALEQFDSTVSDDQRLVLQRHDIYDLLKLFYEEKTDETKQVKRFDALINRVSELGFLKELKGNQNAFEIRRIIKAQFDAEKLTEIKNKMMAEIGVNR